MDWPATTKFVLLAFIVLLVAYDFVAFWCGGKDGTISNVAYECLRDHPILAIAIGAVIGHIWWRN